MLIEFNEKLFSALRWFTAVPRSAQCIQRPQITADTIPNSFLIEWTEKWKKKRWIKWKYFRERADRDESSMTIWLRRARLEKGDYKKFVKQLFHFYGNEWENNSLMNNRWRDRRLNSKFLVKYIEISRKVFRENSEPEENNFVLELSQLCGQWNFFNHKLTALCVSTIVVITQKP